MSFSEAKLAAAAAFRLAFDEVITPNFRLIAAIAPAMEKGSPITAEREINYGEATTFCANRWPCLPRSHVTMLALRAG